MNSNFDEKKLLDLFVDKENIFKPECEKPYRKDGYVYATNGKKLIKIREDIIKGEYDTTDRMELDIPDSNCNYIIAAEDIEEVLSTIEKVDEIIYVGHDVECPECGGEGTVTWKYTDRNWEDYELEEDCPVCDGSGYIEKEKHVKTGRVIPRLGAIVRVGKNNITADNLNVLLNAMRIIGVNEVSLIYQKGVLNHFRIDENISVILASNICHEEYELKLRQGGEK